MISRGNVETGVDKLLNIVNEHHEINMCQATQYLQVPKHVLERWADTLAKEKLIVMKHSFRDTVLLSNDRHESKKPELLKSLKKGLKAFLFKTNPYDEDALKKRAEKLCKREKALERQITSLKRKSKENLEFKMKLESRKDELDERRRQLQDKADSLDEREGDIKFREERFDLAFAKLSSKEDELYKETQKSRELRAKLQSNVDILKNWRDSFENSARELLEKMEEDTLENDNYQKSFTGRLKSTIMPKIRK